MILSDVLAASIAWRPVDGDLVLLAGTVADLPVIETALATLPAKARGQVFVEVTGPDEVRDLNAPGRVCVTWLDRSAGRSVDVALEAWLAEMLPVEFDREHRVYAWIAGQGSARIISS
ncbi:MAG: siderophore-interacting protein [Schumannella sp.]|jgi:NADPH-dependent ferric siderophore reductase|nr:siderophore-interacting protein [Schumannella sp.]